MQLGIGKKETVASLSEGTVVLVSFDAIVGAWNEANDEEVGSLRRGCVDVLPSVNGQLASLRRARAVK